MSKLNSPFENISLNEANEPRDRIRQALHEAGIVSGEFYNLILDVAEPIWVSRVRFFEEALAFAALEEHFEDQLKTFADKFGLKATFSQLPKLSELAKAAALGPFKEKPFSFLDAFPLLLVRPLSSLHQFYDNNFYSQPIFFNNISRYPNAEERLLGFSRLLIVNAAEHLIRNFRDGHPLHVHEISISAFLLQWQKEFIRGNLPFGPDKERLTNGHGSYINLSDLKGCAPDDISSTEIDRANEILASSIEAALGEDLTEFEICHKPIESSSELPHWWVNAPRMDEIPEDRKKELLPLSVTKDLSQLSKKPDNWMYLTTFSDLWLLRWYVTLMRELWRKEFKTQLSNLPDQQRFNVICNLYQAGTIISFPLEPSHESDRTWYPETVSGLYGYEDSSGERRHWVCEIETKDHEWILDQFRKLPNLLRGNDRHLWATWAAIAIRSGERVKDDEILPWAIKGLAMMRDQMADGEFDEKQIWFHQLCMDLLEKKDPKQLLKLLLLAHRSSVKPNTRNDLSADSDHNYNNANSDYPDFFLTLGCRLRSLLKQRFELSNESDCHVAIYREFIHLSELRDEFVDYLLSRLRLKKKQKPNDDGYQNDQIVESDHLWRQAYLKALIELDIDPGGKVHRAAHFIRNNDPDKDVRAAAKSVVKNVKKKNGPSDTVGLRRSMLAAYWWLRLAQHRALGAEDVDYQAALRTRRRELRSIQ